MFAYSSLKQDLVVVLLAVLIPFFYRRRTAKGTLPPGPKPLPFIGNILPKGKDWETYTKWAEEYGCVIWCSSEISNKIGSYRRRRLRSFFWEAYNHSEYLQSCLWSTGKSLRNLFGQTLPCNAYGPVGIVNHLPWDVTPLTFRFRS